MLNEENVNILVVDDIEKNLVTMRAVLDRPDLSILSARSGVEALEYLLQNEVALALVDVNMPEMSGFEFAEIIRSNPKTRNIPIIFITAALNEPAHAFHGYKTGAVDYLNKPFNPDVLRSKVDVFVELYRQRKQLALHLEQLQKALETNEMFTAVLGHDLRTPLAAVMAGSELIGQITTDSKVASTAKLIQTSAERMDTMVSQLLDLARARAGKIKLNLQSNDYRELCEYIIAELTDPREPRTIKLESKGDTHATFDRERFAQIISNLIGNALKHGAPDTPVTVTVDGSDRERVALSVHNQGSIPANQLAKIFEPYHSAQDTSSASNGLGLGLYIVMQLVQVHGGKVQVRSSPERGTCFETIMPRNISSTSQNAFT